MVPRLLFLHLESTTALTYRSVPTRSAVELPQTLYCDRCWKWRHQPGSFQDWPITTVELPDSAYKKLSKRHGKSRGQYQGTNRYLPHFLCNRPVWPDPLPTLLSPSCQPALSHVAPHASNAAHPRHLELAVFGRSGARGPKRGKCPLLATVKAQPESRNHC